jgi:hypothetical protein
MEGENIRYGDQFTFISINVDGFRPSYHITKFVNQVSTGDYVKNNVMVMGKLEYQLHFNIKIIVNYQRHTKQYKRL